MTSVFVPKESFPGETRVSIVPETVERLAKKDIEVLVESGAGVGSHFSDSAYSEAGARVLADPADGWSKADVVAKVRHFERDEIARLGDSGRGKILLGLLAPHRYLDEVRALTRAGVTSFGMELVPRISRAQSMDVLSSQASLAGYKAVLLAAGTLERYFPLMMTAAGTISPARVVVMGAGVAGLQALATAKRLGAVVEVSDIRPAVKEQVESLGGRFIDLPLEEESGEGEGGYAKQMSEDFLRKQREIVAKRVAASDVVITTALIPGKPAPKLVSREMVESMRSGSVVVDLAIEQGGNCELSVADTTTVHDDVTILAPSNLAATMASDASTLYSRNVYAFLMNMHGDEGVVLDLEDEVVAGSLLTHEGEVRHERTASALAASEETGSTGGAS